MEDLIRKQLNSLKENIASFKAEYGERLTQIIEEIQRLVSEQDIIKANWLGTWFNETFDVYSDFKNKSVTHFRITHEQIIEYLHDKTGVDVDHLRDEVNEILLKCKKLNRQIVTELSLIKDDSKFSTQLSLLNSLEEYEWGFPAINFVEMIRPKQFMGNYFDAQRIMNAGYSVPPHISVGSESMSIMSEITSIEEHQKIAERLIREIEIKINTSVVSQEPDHENNLRRLIDRFHIVAKQLLNRHGGRDTLTLNDEYDVQDLFHAILKIYFDDVRPEEFTPSYAGKNTRVDFLLKEHRIMVEIKKLRTGQKDKDIGDELLQDIARYKNHPDCDKLYCFVYDPTSLVNNPRGLEIDLMSESSEKLEIHVFIRP